VPSAWTALEAMVHPANSTSALPSAWAAASADRRGIEAYPSKSTTDVPSALAATNAIVFPEKATVATPSARDLPDPRAQLG
jgi:hypothetical protein